MCHTSELSYSRVNHADEPIQYRGSVDLKVITIDKEKLQIGCSVKQLTGPFDHIESYELNKEYKVKITKTMEFGAFCELEPGLTTLLHNSEISWNKNASAKKMFKVNDIISCVITEINKEKRRVAISHRLTLKTLLKLLNKSINWQYC